MNEVVGIIPARGGSKRLPKKNITKLNGLPMIEYTIMAAKKCPLVNRVLVSTENEEIATISKKAGAEVPFIRPSELAQDHSNVIDTCLHLLKELKNKEGYEPDVIVLLQPTSPLRTERHIDEALRLLQQKDADSVLSVCPMEFTLNSMLEFTHEETMTPFFSELDLKHFETNKHVFRLNGAIYAVKTSYLKKNKSFYSEKTYPYLMSPNESIDIDTEFDFQIASFLMGKEKK
ncbi:acylneuraminate cytidylyltransferase family protein [Metabacillus rhizolycopersici]|uniref:Acylneuraminate cytidylyltransferase family protein n=1 Tax=Metabacillus rhizolycopersici TaxID=2875709 RepID=A0ABS7UVG6_9BACI|nr:acylneuraminate cytidylyltransferase family protein [Metabacillus rhizolycopersici]MBZ5751968.1 acylneuraminate cytidylyltransferase family protein [Metabacillus rhizolycopersici]